jgi:TolB-like protein/DNA-binding winged helix-turn-helix (wHTH) protein/Tfp pilus assembly protein PilF
MERAVSSGQIFRFGLFEADSTRNTLTRKGVRVKIHDQPFRVLILLLENAAEVVTRDELRQKLWPEGTHVDFDGSLNVILKKLRSAIDDDSDNPRFIETVPRRGYRFIAPVSEISQHQIISQEDAIADAPAEGGNREAAREEFTSDSGRVTTSALTPGLRTWPGSWKLTIFVTGLALLLAGFIYAMRPHPSSNSGARKRVMLAVLPFKNLSNDPEQEYFSDGLTEETITDLGQISPEHLGVIARTSAMAYKHSDKTVSQIGRELGVDYILEGSVRREEGKARISAQLIRVADQTHLWARNYDRDLKDLIEVQNDLGNAIAEQVQANLAPQLKIEPEPSERVHLASARRVDPEAQDAYLRGRFFWNHGTTGALGRDRTELELDLQTAIEYFKRAIDQSPDYALAYAGLADAYIELGEGHEGGHYPKETLPEAKAAATRASELDPSLAEAHFSLAQTIELYDWNWWEAEKEYRLALELNPNYADAHLEYGRFLQALGRNDEATAQMNYAIELDPFNFKTRDIVGYVIYASGHYDLAIKQFSSLGDDFGLGWAYREKKMYPEAIAALERSLSRSGRHELPLASLAGVYGFAGRRGDALKLIDELTERGRLIYVPSSLFAQAYIGLGEKNRALGWMERAYEEHDQGMVYIKTYPGWDALRSEPRFQALVQRMNFPQ